MIKSSDEERAALASAPFDLPVKLLQGYPESWIAIEVGIAPQRFRDPTVVIVEHGRQRFQQMSGKDGSLAFGQIERKYLEFSDGSHD
jgi:hypothetical protein